MEDFVTRCSFAWATRCLTYVRVVERSCLPTSWIRHNRPRHPCEAASERTLYRWLSPQGRTGFQSRTWITWFKPLPITPSPFGTIDAYCTERWLLRWHRCPRFNRARRQALYVDYRFQKARDKLRLLFRNQVRRYLALRRSVGS